ncbi:MAG: DUF4173 domain-containing protein [Coriobacteriia bacterium]|nr:DUF4173 domain-containing protein [Coriobacteriia bacterium]MCL2745539.1 DUF4173 domain-containing protein [Coriobacteriia bacterium]MCL2870835.1 DUF4173 domain-containing protein [Coriobacteriia bacterium]
MKKYIVWICAALGSAAVVELFFFSPPALGWTLLFLICLVLYFVCYGVKEFPKAVDWALIATIVGLALPFTLFNNAPLRWFNFIAITICLLVLFLRRIVPEDTGWDKLAFYGEMFAGAVVRPFAYIVHPWRESFNARRTAAVPTPVSAVDAAVPPVADAGMYAEAGANPVFPNPAIHGQYPDTERVARSKRRQAIALQVSLALLVAVPLLTILGSFLYSSDPVFAALVDGVVRFIVNLNIGTILLHASIMVLIFPFALSFFWSFNKGKLVTIRPKVPQNHVQAPPEKKAKFKLPSIFSATLLLLINLMYFVYAVVQFRFLFAGTSGTLPEGLSLIYAEYARSGFFELVTLAIFNFVLIAISAYFTHREGRAGVVLRILTITLVALSTIQLASATSRMDLYIQTFGLSQLRLFVLAYIAFIAVVFVLFIIRELLSKRATPLFKAAAFSALVLLLGMNYIVPDALIARYNIDRQIAGELKVQRFDFNYYAYQLSFDSTRVLLENEQRLLEAKPELESDFRRLHSALSRTRADVPSMRPTQGQWGYFSSYRVWGLDEKESFYVAGNNRMPFMERERYDNTWRSFNLSSERLFRMADARSEAIY